MSYGFRAGGQARTRRQPKMDDDNIVTALRRSLAGGEPRRASSQRGSTPRTNLPGYLSENMPVSLSNGEYEFTPDQVYAIGLKAIQAMEEGPLNEVGRAGFVSGGAGWQKILGKLWKHVGPVGELADAASSTYDAWNGGRKIVNGDVSDGLGDLASSAWGSKELGLPGYLINGTAALSGAAGTALYNNVPGVEKAARGFFDWWDPSGKLEKNRIAQEAQDQVINEMQSSIRRRKAQESIDETKKMLRDPQNYQQPSNPTTQGNMPSTSVPPRRLTVAPAPKRNLPCVVPAGSARQSQLQARSNFDAEMSNANIDPNASPDDIANARIRYMMNNSDAREKFNRLQQSARTNISVYPDASGQLQFVGNGELNSDEE